MRQVYLPITLMAYSRGQLKTASVTSRQREVNSSSNSNRNVVYIPGSLDIDRPGDFSPWASRQLYRQSMDCYRSFPTSPERILLSGDYRNSASDDFRRSDINMPPLLPSWIWNILVTTLGIGPATSKNSYYIATLLHVLTLTSAFLFGVSGLFFNAYDALSESTRTSLLICVAKSILGLYWIGIGIYANILAARLFSNQRMVDCVRLHSKTFLKVNTAFIVMLLSAVVVIVNLYSNTHLLKSQKPASDDEAASDDNCAKIGVSVTLCRIYFGAKVVYSGFCLMWNLLVVGIFLSVCRTHTISIRRFMKQLLCDTKIYAEFHKLRALEKQVDYVQSLPAEARQNQQPTIAYPDNSDSNIWDDDILGFDQGTDSPSEPNNAVLLETLRQMLMSTSDLLAGEMVSSFQGHHLRSDGGIIDNAVAAAWKDDEESEHLDTESASSHNSNDGGKQPAPQTDSWLGTQGQQSAGGYRDSDGNARQQSVGGYRDSDGNARQQSAGGYRDSDGNARQQPADFLHSDENARQQPTLGFLDSYENVRQQPADFPHSDENRPAPGYPESNKNARQQPADYPHLDENARQWPAPGYLDSDENANQTDEAQEEPNPEIELNEMLARLNPRQVNEAKLKNMKPSNVRTISTNTSKSKVISDPGPPIMSNEELFFTYFLLLRRFSSTSRLLQRWISNWIAFVMLWCGSFVVYWSSHSAQLSGITQFLIPLVTLGLLTSGYAEVNFEGERLIKCVLPTDERMSVLYYFQNSKLELKIFSFTMTYNTIVTVVAGIAVTFGTRIILDEFSGVKGHTI